MEMIIAPFLVRTQDSQSNYEQLKWLYENACHIFKQQGWELDMSKLPDLDMEIDGLHDLYGPGAHMILSALFGDMDTSIVVKHLNRIISKGDCYSDSETDWDW